MGKIDNLEQWGLTEEDINRLNNKATIKISLVYPGYASVIAYPPAERRKRISARIRADYATLKVHFSKLDFEKLGSHIRPAGIRVQLPLSQLPTLATLKSVAAIHIEQIEGLNPVAQATPKMEVSLWAIKARFAIQIENQVKGLQGFEDRVLLLRAINEEDAQRKLLPEFERYAEPYLNSAGQLVRWKFEKFLDAYEAVPGILAGSASEEYLEVFSESKNRKLIPGLAWKGTSADPAG